MQSQLSRRRFIKKSVLSAGFLPLLPYLKPSHLSVQKSQPLPIHIFSKHLQFLDYEEMAEAAATIGFDGVELSVRPKGHVLPENVRQDLPKAIAAVRKQGLSADMIVTRITDADAKLNQEVLQTAADEGIRHYRMGYFRDLKEYSVLQNIEFCKVSMRKLASLNARLGLTGNYQNHAGTRVGANIWEIWQMLEGLEASALGCQYDIRHAVVEGGLSWGTGLKLIKDKINNIVLKDFRWEKREGKWRVLNTPIGEGMVDFKRYFGLLKAYNIHLPVSLHCEYDLGGAEHGDRELKNGWDKARVIEAMKSDLTKIHEIWASA